MRPRVNRPPASELESTLESLLDAPQAKRPQDPAPEPASEPSPMDLLRKLIAERCAPVIDRFNAHYADRDISVSMDAADFLNGGRGLTIDVYYQGARLHLEGTVTTDAIAFHETRQFPDRPGVVVAGPMLRTKGLDDRTFNDFLHARTIALVKAATAGK